MKLTSQQIKRMHELAKHYNENQKEADNMAFKNLRKWGAI